MESDIEGARALLWARIDKTDKSMGFFDNMSDRPIRSDEWNVYSIEGVVDEKADSLIFGGLVFNNGKFFFDDFKLSVWEEDAWQPLPISNPGFEDTNISEKSIAGWFGNVVPIENFTPSFHHGGGI
jgi:hypothetical protein